jgi:hypothetical protein
MDFTMLATFNVIVFFLNGYWFFPSSGFGGHVENFGGPYIVSSWHLRWKNQVEKVLSF